MHTSAKHGCLLLAALALGCAEDGVVASDPDGSATGWIQSETSMARARRLDGHPRLILGYNDGTHIHDNNGVFDVNYSFLGLSISDDYGATWQRRGQLPTSTEIPALRGDPWIAASGSLVLYAGMRGPPGGSTSLPGADGVVLGVSADAADNWYGIVTIHEGNVDGPKVALSRDRSLAIVTWIELEQGGAFRRTRYMIVRDPASIPLDLDGPYDLDEQMGWSPPIMEGFVPACDPENPDPARRYMQAFALSHPVPAIGPTDGDLYIGRVIQYRNALVGFCSLIAQDELEVFRSSDEGLTWSRILSRPLGIGGNRDGEMLAHNGGVTRAGTRPALAVTSIGEGDEVLVALEQLDAGAGRQRILLRRVDGADTCPTTNKYREGCPWSDSYPSAYVVFEYMQEDYEANESLHHFAYQPALFTGDSEQGLDSRVALSFYVQPRRGDPASNDLQRRFTTVVGLLSPDGARSWVPGSGLTVDVPGRTPQYMDSYEGHSGIVFVPCPKDDSDYFGDYNGGAFQLDGTKLFAVAAWADSREGCTYQGDWRTTHQQVFTARFLVGGP